MGRHSIAAMLFAVLVSSCGGGGSASPKPSPGIRVSDPSPLTEPIHNTHAWLLGGWSGRLIEEPDSRARRTVSIFVEDDGNESSFACRFWVSDSPCFEPPPLNASTSPYAGRIMPGGDGLVFVSQRVGLEMFVAVGGYALAGRFVSETPTCGLAGPVAFIR